MKYPSKITAYKDSVISKMPIVMEALSEGDLCVYDLYQSLRANFSGIEEFIDTLDCLYALHQIGYDQKNGVIHYVT